MLNCKTARDVMKIVRDRNVSFIQIWFTDVLGMMKSFAITPSELEGALTEGMGFDGSSIEGFARIEESDMIAKPDPTTFQFIPWRPKERPVGRMFCDILQPDGSHYEGDSRYALKRMTEKAIAKGYNLYLGPELEYFYFQDPDSPKILDRGGYFDPPPLDVAGDLREIPFLPCRRWESRWNTAIMRLPPASTRLICAMTTPCAWLTRL